MTIDLKKDRKDLYQPGSKEFTEVDVPPMTYLAIDGHGDPNTSRDYSVAVAALHSGAYAIRYALKARTREDFVVGPLEGLWSSPDPTVFTDDKKDEWDWTMMIPLPGPVTSNDITEGLTAAARKKPDLPISSLKRLELHEGRSLQILHVGPYDAEAATLARLHHEVMPARGLHVERAPPRDLPRRSPQGCSRETQDRPAPAGQARRRPRNPGRVLGVRPRVTSGDVRPIAGPSARSGSGDHGRNHTVGGVDPVDAVHRTAPEEAVRALGSSAEGLTTVQAEALLSSHGRNILREQKQRPLILTFLSEFTSPMAILLWVGGVVALVAGIVELGVAVFAVNVINGVFGFWQEYRAERATEELKKMLSSCASVVRDGEVRQVPSEELVPGDLVLVTEGDRISADARVVEANDLQVDQSTLSGESRPVHKHARAIDEDLPMAHLTNMVFAGTNVSSGDGRVIVTSTGMQTEFGRIADLTQSVREERSPLQKELGRLTRQLSVLALALGAFFVAVAVLFVGEPWGRSLIFGLGMIVAFIPEGLLPTVTLSLALAVQRMAKQNAEGSLLAASRANPGTSSGHRARPTTWTTAAAIPTGTAIFMAGCADSRPTPTAIGANSAEATAMTANHPTTAV